MEGVFSQYQLRRTVRVFVSSNSDTQVERDALLEVAVPKLRAHFQQAGIEFQPIDVLTGLHTDDNDRLLTPEVRNFALQTCQRTSLGPCFVTMLGQRYGQRSLPSRIPSDEFQKLHGSLKSEEDKTLAKTWYKLDQNAIPAEYVLEPAEYIYPALGKQVEAEENKQEFDEAATSWVKAYRSLQEKLEAAAAEVLSEERAQVYTRSLVEQEARKAVVDHPEKKSRCYWFRRTIENLHKNASDDKTHIFLDMKDGQVDQNIQKVLTPFRKTELFEAIAPQMVPYDVKWNPKGFDPDQVPEHRTYITKLCRDFEGRMRQLVAKAAEGLQVLSPLELEVRCHGNVAFTLAKDSLPRKEVSSVIEKYLNNTKSTKALGVMGELGVGKSTAIAQALCAFHQAHPDVIIAYRHLGASVSSSRLLSALRSIIQQLILGGKLEGLENRIPAHRLHLSSFLFSVLFPQMKQNVVVVLDGLDQVQASPNDLDWLSRTFPASVKVIAAARSGTDIASHLETCLSSTEIVKMTNLSKSDNIKLITNLLSASNRKLSNNQQKTINGGVSDVSPLFCAVTARVAQTLPSWAGVKMASSVDAVIASYFNQLATKHGQIFVARALSYISLARSGLSWSEWEDILSLDDEVLDSIFQHRPPKHRRLPSAKFLALLQDLDGLLLASDADGPGVNRWRHVQYGVVALATFCSSDDEQAQRCGLMAEYFTGRWAGSRKTYKEFLSGRQVMADRFVPEQPTTFETDEGHAPNVRKMCEAAYHLATAKHWDSLQSDCLLNYEFLYALVKSFGVLEAADLYSLASESSQEALPLIQAALLQSANVVTHDSRLLGGQLAGRLQPHLPSSAQPSAGLRPLAKFLETIHKRGAQSESYALIPRHPCLYPAGSAHATALVHADPVTCAFALEIGVVVSGAGRFVHLWDAYSFQLLKVLPHGAVVTNVSGVSNLCLSAGGLTAKVWKIDTGELLIDCPHSSNVNASAISLDGNQIVTAEANKLSIWSIAEGNCIKSVDIQMTPSHLICTEKFICGGDRTQVQVWTTDGSEKFALQTAYKGNLVCLSEDRLVLASSTEGSEGGLIHSLSKNSQEHLLAVGACHNTAAQGQGKVLFLDHDEDKMELWDVSASPPATALSIKISSHASSSVFTANQHSAFVGADNVLEAYPLSQEPAKECPVPVQTRQTHKGRISALLAVEDLKTAVTVGWNDEESSFAVWDGELASCLKTAEGPPLDGQVDRRLDLYDNGSRLAIGMNNGYGLVDLVAGQWLGQSPTEVPESDNEDSPQEPPHKGSVTCLKLIRDGAGGLVRVVTAGEDGKLKFWEPEEFSVVKTLDAHDGPIRGMAVHPRDQELITVADDMSIKFWDMSTAALQASISIDALPCNIFVDADDVVVQHERHFTTWVKGKDTMKGKTPAGSDAFLCTDANDGKAIASLREGVYVWDTTASMQRWAVATPCTTHAQVRLTMKGIALVGGGARFEVYDADSGQSLAYFLADTALSSFVVNHVETTVLAAFGRGPVCSFQLPSLAKRRIKQSGVNLFGQGLMPDPTLLKNVRSALTSPKRIVEPTISNKPIPAVAEEDQNDENTTEDETLEANNTDGGDAPTEGQEDEATAEPQKKKCCTIL
eukprot:m.196029 g.196029  ORF g.196029 m.196029 type:complete len:1617 (-) comp25842_c0_seq4:105-4955(-)